MCILDLPVKKKIDGKPVIEDLKKTVEILLTETETMTFFNLPTVMISTEAEEADKVLYVWFNCLHCFCNLSAKMEFLILVSILGGTWINTVVYVPGETICYSMCPVKLYLKCLCCMYFFSKGGTHDFTIFF